MRGFFQYTGRFDWMLVAASVLLAGAGLITINSFTADNILFDRQLIWLGVSLIVMLLLSYVDWRILRRTHLIFTFYVVTCLSLLLLFFIGYIAGGAQSWFRIGALSIQPSDPAKLILILLLAKYFSRRHVEIRHLKHILISGAYALILFVLVFLQPDFGSAIIIFFIWFGMVLVSGLSKKHLALVSATGATVMGILWGFVFAPYQKERILSFLNPLADITGAGYNAFQSVVAVGSGGLFGKGVGYGTQSRLQFLPEFETDFIFAAFAEEWGFIGVLLVISLFAVVIWKIISFSQKGDSNFESLFGYGLAIMITTHFFIHVGMNLGLLPITGTTLPFLSYGGSHLLTEFAGLGILFGMKAYSKGIRKHDIHNEFVGPR